MTDQTDRSEHPTDIRSRIGCRPNVAGGAGDGEQAFSLIHREPDLQMAAPDGARRLPPIDPGREAFYAAVRVKGRTFMAMPTWVTEAGVVGTWVVGILALFGDRIRAMLFKPDLHLELRSDVGDCTPQIEYKNGIEVARHHARFYHLRVTNRASWYRYRAAQDVQVLLLAVDHLDNGKQRRPGVLYVPLPLNWAHGIYPLARSIDSKADAIADLLFVRKDVLSFVPVVVPHSFQSVYSGETHLCVTAIARGIDCESNILKLKIDWDGLWELDDDAMKKHFEINPVES